METEEIEEELDDELGFEIDVPERFQVCDDRSAEWVLCKIAEARAVAVRAAKWSKEIAEESRKREESLMARFGIELERYAASKIEGAKKKSFSLPSAKLGFRAKAGKLEVIQPAVALQWAKKNCPLAVDLSLKISGELMDESEMRAALAIAQKFDPFASIEESLSKQTLNHHVKTLGELPDGCQMTAPENNFYFETPLDLGKKSEEHDD